jgi:nucleoside-diphosphate-sugar epimerase
MNGAIMTGKLVVVTGAGGFIGGSMVAELRQSGRCKIRAVDIKPLEQWYQIFPDVENLSLDLNLKEGCERAAENAGDIYNFACDMGGMGFIERNKALCMLSVLINTHMLQAARKFQAGRYFFSSSACVYNGDKQRAPANPGLKEDDAYPALAEDGYGWEKLFSERMCRHFREDFGLSTRVARLHNVYGPHGTWDGGREKAPAAICRKVAEAKIFGNREIIIWGDGTRTRSFMYIDDCVAGVRKIIHSDVVDPLNLGSSELVSINQLVTLVEEIAGIRLKRVYELDAPTGVVGRSSDNALIRERLGWEPGIRLREGMERTYAWIYDQCAARAKLRGAKTRGSGH